MPTIVHLSDLHFGRIHAPALQPLVQAVWQAKPDLVVVSGDLTQRAKDSEFKAAQAFLAELPQPQLVVPGNHDIPLYDTVQRFLFPRLRYKRYISPITDPIFINQNMAVFGLDTSRSGTFKGGRISARQLRALRKGLESVPKGIFKIVVTHHPFDLPEGSTDSVVRNAKNAMHVLTLCHTDLVLSGHLHQSFFQSSARRYQDADYAVVVVQAGTAISSRNRGEANEFNVITLQAGKPEAQLGVDVYLWSEQGGFALQETKKFRRTSAGWGTD